MKIAVWHHLPSGGGATGRRGRELVEERRTVEQSVACVERHLLEVARAGRGGRREDAPA